MSRLSRWFDRVVCGGSLLSRRSWLWPLAALGLLANGALAQLPAPDTIAFANGVYTVYDTNQGAFNVMVLCGGCATDVQVDCNVDATQPNTAVLGEDYVFALTPVKFAAGETAQSVVVTILPTCTAGRSLFLRLSNPTTPAVIGSPAVTELRIVTPPPQKLAAGEFSFSRTYYRVTEFEYPYLFSVDGIQVPTVEGALITVHRLNGSQGRVSVDWSASCLTDPTFQLNGTLIFDDGQTSTNFNIDSMDFPMNLPLPTPPLPELAVDLTLSNPQPDPLENPQLVQPTLSTTLPVTSTLGIVTIFDPTFQTVPLHWASLFSLHWRVDEYGNRLAWVSVFLNGAGANPPITVLLTAATSPRHQYYPFAGVAELAEGSDYATDPDANTITIEYAFPQGINLVTHSIPINPDTLVEFNEDMGLRLDRGGSNPCDGIVPGARFGDLTILYDDMPPGAADREWNPPEVPYSTPPFMQVPGANNQVLSVAVGLDGKAIIGGEFTDVNSQIRNRIARFNLDGSLDTNFVAYPNSGANGFVSKVVALTDATNAGRILIAGAFSSYNGIQRNCIARLLPDGNLDPSFTPGTGAYRLDGLPAAIWNVAVQTDGKYIIAGDFTRYNDKDRNFLARLNQDGTLDETFKPNFGPADTVLALGFDFPTEGSQKIYIGGRFTEFDTVFRNHIARLNPDGTLDTTFDPGRGANGPVYALAVQPVDGKVIIGGSFDDFNSKRRNNIARLNVDGSLDTAFDPGKGADDAIYSIVIRPDGKAYIAGIFESYNETRRVGMAMLRFDGTLDTSFMDSAYNQFAGVIRKWTFDPRNFVNSIALQPDGNLMIGGSFTNLGGNMPQYVNDNFPYHNPSYRYQHVWTRQDKINRFNVARIVGTWGGADQGPGNVEFAYSSYGTSERQGTFQVTMTRSDGLLGTAIGLVATSNRTAIAGEKYVAQTDVPMQFNEYTDGIMRSHGFGGPIYLDIPIINEEVVEGNKVFDMGLYHPTGQINLGMELVPLGTALGRSFAPTTILDDDQYRGVLVFSSPTFQVDENGTNAVLTVLRTNGSAGTVSVDFFTRTDPKQKYPATSGPSWDMSRDYTYTSNRLTFAEGVTNQVIRIPIFNDTLVEHDENFFVTLTNATGGAILPGGTPTSTTSAMVTIIDDDYPSGHLNFTATNYVVDEGAGFVAVTVTRTGGNLGPLYTSLVTSNGTAVAGLNYFNTSNYLYWANGDTSPRIVSIPILHDGVFKPDLDFSVHLIKPRSTSDLGDISSATVKIVNIDFPGAFVFSQAAYVGDENGTNVTITVLRQGGSAGQVSVDFRTDDDSAQANIDYEPTSGTLVFMPGEVSKSFPVFFIDNAAQDGNRTVALVLSNPLNGASLGAVSTARLTIVDDESFTEPAGKLDTTFVTGLGPNLPVYSLVLQPDTNLLVGGEFRTYDNIPAPSLSRVRADGGLDTFFNIGNGFNDQLRAIALQPDGKILVAGFFTNVDNVNRSHIARLYHDGSRDDYFDPGAGANDVIYAIALQPNDGRVLVGGAFTTFDGIRRPHLARLNTNGTVNLAFNATNGPDGVVYAIALQPDGKIVIGGDFTNVNNVPQYRVARLLPDGTLDTTFNVGPGADAPVRSLLVQSDGRIIVGGSFTNFAGEVRPFLVRLETSGAIDPTFLNGQSGPNDSVYTMALQVDEKILLGGAFTKVNGVTRNRITRLNRDGTTDPSINFGLGANGFVASLVVQPDRKIVLGGGFTTYDGQTRNHLARIHGGSLRGNGAFEFSTPYYSVIENEPVAIVEVMRRGGTFGDTTVEYSTIDGTATDSLDYVGATAALLNFPQGEAVQTIGIPLINDLLVEDPETVYLFLDNPTGNATIGVVPLSVLTIISDDSQIGFYNASYTVAENTATGVAPITIVRVGATNDTSAVDYMALPGTATTNSFVAVRGTVIFEPGESNKIFQVPIIDDLLVNGNRTVNLVLTNSQPADRVTLSLSNAVLDILDNEWAPGELMFSSAYYSVSEAGTNAVITVIRTNGTTGIVSVHYDTSDGTATNGIDYLATSGVLSFADGEAVKSFYVPVIDDHKPGPDKTVNLALSFPGGGATLGYPTNALLTIEETEPGASYFGFQTPVFGVNERDGFATITILRSNSRRGTASVDFYTHDGTAAAGLDYVGTNMTLTLGDNQSSTNVDIPILNNRLGTPDLTVQLVLTNPSPGNFVSMPDATLIITNDDTSFEFSAPTYSVLKGASNLTVTVLRTGRSNSLASVSYQTVDNGTAVAGLDYKPATGTLTWAPFDAAAKTFEVPIIYHAGAVPDKTFGVSLRTPIGGFNTYLGIPSNAVVTIVNDETFTAPAGSVDPAFNANLGANASVYTVAYDSQRRLYAGGDFTYIHGYPQNHFTRLTTNGTVDGTFDIGSGFDNSVYAALPLGDEILVGGDFTNYNGTRFDRVALLGPSGLPATRFKPTFGADGAVRAMALVNLSTFTFTRSSTQGVNNSDTNGWIIDPSIGGTISLDITFTPLMGTNGPVLVTNNLIISYNALPLLWRDVVVWSNAVTVSVTNLAFPTGGNGQLVVSVNYNLTNGGPWTYQGSVTIGTELDRPVYLGGSFTHVNGTAMNRLARIGQDGVLDTTFNIGNGFDNTIYAVAVLPNDQVLVAGDFSAFNGMRFPRLARLNSDGTVDGTFNPNLGADGAIRALAVQPDGRFLIGGDFQTIDGVPFSHIARLNADGSVDLSFDPGVPPDGPVYSLALQDNGQVVIVGNFTSIGGNPFARVARLNADGSLDAAFNPGSGADALVRSVSLTSVTLPPITTSRTNSGSYLENRLTVDTGATNGVITLDYGFFGTSNNVRFYYDNFLIYDLTTNGSGQITIPYGPGNSTYVTVVMNEGGGQLGAFWTYRLTTTASGLTETMAAIGGDFSKVNGQTYHRLAVLNGSGTLDSSFNPGASGSIAVYSVGIYTNLAMPELVGKLVVGGDFTSVAGGAANRVARLNIDGTVDVTFDPGTGPNGAVHAVALQPDGRAIVGGTFTTVNGEARSYLARFLTSGLLDPQYNSGVGPDNSINAMLLQPDGKLLIAGQFTKVYGANRSGVARMTTSGTVDTTFAVGAGANRAVNAVAFQPDGRVVIGGDFTSFDGQARVRVARLTANGALDTTFNALGGANKPVNAVAVQPDGRILVGGAFTTFNGVAAVGGIVRLNPDGTLDATFNPGLGADDYVSSIVLQPDGQILVGGGFVNWNGQTHRRLIRLNADGSIDPTINFGTGANNFIAAVALQDYDDKIVVGGAFTEFNGEPRVALARLFGGANFGAGSFQFSAPSYSASEASSNAVATVLRTGGATGTARVSFSTSDDTAKAGVDYRAASGTLTFTNGEVEKTLSIALMDDSQTNMPRRFNVILSNPVGATLATQSVTKVNILDNDSVIRFSTPDYVVNEGAGSARITVQRLGGSIESVAVDCLTTTNGTAGAYFNYLPVTATLVFTPGVNVQTFNVPILANALTEPPLTVAMILSNAVGPATLGLSDATLTIVDSNPQPGVFSFLTNTFSVVENMGFASITVVRSGGYSGQVSVNYATGVGGSATPVPNPAADYYPTNGTLVFADGESNKTFNVAVINDGRVNGTRTVQLTLTGATGGAAIGQGASTLQIMDDDSYGSFVFQEPVFSVTENQGVATINVLRVGGTIGQATVKVQTSGGTAVPGVDYSAVTKTLTFAAGQTSVSFTIPVTDDATVKGTRTVGLLLSDQTGGTSIGTPGTATLLIYDNETSYTFAQPAYSVPETGRYQVIDVLRVGNTNTASTVIASASGGTAIPGADFVATNVVLDFAPGETNRQFAVMVLDDTLPEGDEFANLTLSSPSGGGSLGPILNARLIILDDDTAVSFSSANYTVTESFTNVVITVVRYGATNRTSSVNYTVSDGTAISGVNYFGIPGTLDFLPGQTTNTFTVFVYNDYVAGGDVTVNLGLGGPVGAVLGAQPTAVLTILESDSSVGFSSTNYVASEASGNAFITLVRKGLATSPLTVTFVTSNGTAIAGTDYVRTSNQVTWAANDLTPKQVQVPIIADSAPEGTETVRLLLANAPVGVIIDPAAAVLRIVDDAGSIAFSSVTVTNVNEGDSAAITLNRTGGSNGVVTVDYRTVGGSATPDIDFQNPNGTLVFGDGETTKTFFLPVVADNLVEGIETAQISLLNATGGAMVGSPGQMTLSIIDKNLGILISAGSALNSESGPVNGVIDPGETVTVGFAIRNVGVVNTTNLVGILVAGNGVAMPSGGLTQTQYFGKVVAGGASVTVPYTFRAVGTNGGQIVATLILKEGADSPYTNAVVTYTYALGSAFYTFGNAGRIDINDAQPASPYPSVIRVAGVNGPVGKLTVTVSGLSHTWPADIDMLLVGPGGQAVMLMSDAGYNKAISDVTLTFDDASTSLLPSSAQIVSGTYHPANYPTLSDPFSAPPSPYAPIATPYSTNLSSFIGSQADGDWQLYIVDDTSFNSGVILRGWSLTIQASEPIVPTADLSVNMTDSPHPVVAGEPLVYTTAVTNHGPGTATSALVTNTLPAGLSPSVVSVSQGSYEIVSAGASIQVIGHLGSLPNGGFATMSVAVTAPSAATQLLATAGVGSALADVNPADNAASVRTPVVVMPVLKFARKSGNLLLSWSAASGSYILQTSPTLVPASWTKAPQTVSLVNGYYTVSIPMTGAGQFYRLKSQ